MNLHERAFVGSFLQKARRERALLCLANPKKRHEYIEWLIDSGRDVLVPECVRSIQPNQQHPDPICAILRSLGAPETCYLISEHSSYDGKELSLLAAIKEIIGNGDGMGSVISCLPGRLGYFEGEWKQRFILQK
jgi:hypothetical protein